MDPTNLEKWGSRLLYRVFIEILPRLFTGGPGATFIRSWSSIQAAVAWASLAALLGALLIGAVRFFVEMRSVAGIGCLLAALLLGYCMVLVGMVRSELHDERSRLRLP